MKIIYITVQIPWGRRKTFVLDEMLAMQKLGTDLLIVPRNPPSEVFYKGVQRLLERAI